jgi:hypothetical protein
MNSKYLLRYSVAFLLAMHSLFAHSQNIQTSIGSVGKTESFVDSKFDINDGGTINVGFVDSNTGFSNDLLFVKLDVNHQIVWQKTIPNTGSDILYRVIVCTNGDYVAAGQFCVGGIRKGFVCRINSSNGNIIWSKISNNTSDEQVFWDVIETNSNNIAVVGAENFLSGQTNSFIVLLNSTGNIIWSKQSSTFRADEIRSVIQLPNGNLLFVGFYNPNAFNYYAYITEIEEATAVIKNQNIYNINTISPDGNVFLNSLWSNNIFTRGSDVLMQLSAFQGYGSASFSCLFKLNLTTKVLTGNIYHHTGAGQLTGLTFYPISENDFLTSLSSTAPIQTFISRITNGSIIFDRSVNNNTKSISGMDAFNTDISFAGSKLNTDIDAYNFFTTINVPTATTPCDVSNSNSLVLIPITLNPTAAAVVSFLNTDSLVDISLTLQNTTNIITDICGFVLPIQLLSFNAACSPEIKLKIHWTTASESNSKEFIVEKLNKEGNSYFKIGSVAAAGNSNVTKQYHFTDINPINGKQFYRLKMVDRDGTFKYSDIEVADCSSNQYNEFSISPVPAATETWIRYAGTESQNITVDIYDAAGKLMKHQTAFINASNPVRITLQEFSAGLYFLKITSKNNQAVIKKIMVQ